MTGPIARLFDSNATPTGCDLLAAFSRELDPYRRKPKMCDPWDLRVQQDRRWLYEILMADCRDDQDAVDILMGLQELLGVRTPEFDTTDDCVTSMIEAASRIGERRDREMGDAA